MNGSENSSERLVAVFLLGVFLFSPPFMLIFDKLAEIAGIPLLYLYLFTAWAVLIALMALIIEHMEGEREANEEATTEKPSGAERGPGGAI